MDKKEMTKSILEAKSKEGLSWDAIAKELGRSPVWTASACLGNNSMLPDEAKRLCNRLNLPESVAQALQTCPTKGEGQVIPSDPLIYRFFEIAYVYGPSIKEVIHESFGDGIMSAIDFTVDVEREEDPKGDRVKVVMNGKFLPYKKW